MGKHGKPVEVLLRDESWALLASQRVGRIVTRINDVMDIVPINYVVDGESIVFRTAAGSKLAELALSPAVLFEVDSFDDRKGWSVVVRGNARIVSRPDEVAAVEDLGLRTSVATRKPTFVRIEAETVTGRAFTFKTEPGEE